jgi:hypothetical protein
MCFLLSTIKKVMNDPLLWIAFSLAAFGTFFAALVTVKGYGLIRIRGLNLSRLKELQQIKEKSKSDSKKQALDSIINQCKTIRNKWILTEEDLNLTENTLDLVKKIATIYHPDSKNPIDEARIGNLLKAFHEIKNSVLTLTRMKGIRGLTQFRLHHLYSLSEAWKWKEEWQKSPAAQRIRQYKLYSILKWAWMIFRFMDLVFWSLKMLGYIIYDVIFKILLVQWYLIIGELSMQVYSDAEEESDVSQDELLKDLEEMSEQHNSLSEDYPEEIRNIASASKKSILLNYKTISREEVSEIYYQLATNIAKHYHPLSEEPIHEAKIYDLMLGAIRLADEISSLESIPILNKLLGIRISHILMVKNAADYIVDNPIVQNLSKYKVGDAIKYAAMAYKVVSKRHPGILVKDLAFNLTVEAGKRWLYIYLHDKIVLEANAIYSEQFQIEENIS